MKFKLLTVVGTRPELIRLSEIIKLFDIKFNHRLVHTNQNYDKNLNDIFFNQLNIRKPDYILKNKYNTAVQFIAKTLDEIEKIIILEKPDVFFILGDTNSCLSALVAKKYKIPIFHYEAGNRCFDQRVPEEINRKVIDHISDINLTYSDYARQNLIKEGIQQDRIIKVGGPLKEVFLSNKIKIDKSQILKKLNLQENNYFLVSYHREENVDDEQKLKKFLFCLNQLSNKYKIKIIISTHPRTEKKLKKIMIKRNKLLKFEKPFGYYDYIKLQQNSLITISDSGSISEEASILNFKAISLRNTMERQEAMETPSVIMSNLEPEYLLRCVEFLIKEKKIRQIYKDYDVNSVSEKISKIILSYTQYINFEVWKK